MWRFDDFVGSSGHRNLNGIYTEFIRKHNLTKISNKMRSSTSQSVCGIKKCGVLFCTSLFYS